MGETLWLLLQAAKMSVLTWRWRSNLQKGAIWGYFLDLPPTRLSANGNVGSDFF